ncbi:pickpocket protein 28-like [Culicoides brevitarsis]|uniref:pickpocket protein 28-like n=1 Tax=Culicoides brevitarsis TaxID=469753 RepID=UPI00307C2C09
MDSTVPSVEFAQMGPLSMKLKKKKKPKIDTRTALKETFLDFCSCTSIHGVQYIGIRKRFDRLFWITLVIGFVILAIVLAVPIVEKWRNNPIEMDFEQKFIPIRDFPFPAITICPLQMPHNELFNFSDVLSKASDDGFGSMSREKLQLFKLMTQTCFSQLGSRLAELSKASDRFPNDIPDIDENIFNENFLLPSSFSLYKCQGVKRNSDWMCDTELHRHLLDVGLCYSFNMLPKEKILRPEVEYPLGLRPNFVPPNITYFENDQKSENLHRVNQTHQIFQLEMHSHAEFEQEICQPDFIFYVHSPFELPWDQTNRFRMQLSEQRELFVAVEPDVVITDDALRRYLPQVRDCYFPDERQLKYFLEYTKNNCEFECYINATERKYDCLPEFMPQTKNTKKCNLSQTLRLLQSIWSFESEKRDGDCNCLNDCNSLEFQVRLSDVHHTRRRSTENLQNSENEENFLSETRKSEIIEKIYLMKTDPDDIPHDLSETHFQDEFLANYSEFRKHVKFEPLSWNASFLHIYYSKTQFLPMKRFTTYTFADFIAQWGGIFGGIMGFSFLSFVEIFYFCTIRFLEKRKLTPIDVIQDEFQS